MSNSCNHMNCRTPGISILCYPPEFAQSQVHWIGDAIQPSHPLSPISPPALNFSQHLSNPHEIQFCSGHCSSCCCCSVTKSCLALCDRMDCSMPGFPVLHHLAASAQTYVHRVSDAIQLSHPLLPPSSPAFNLSQCHGLFQWVSPSHQVVKVLELQLQHQSFQWTPRIDLL